MPEHPCWLLSLCISFLRYCIVKPTPLLEPPQKIIPKTPPQTFRLSFWQSKNSTDIANNGVSTLVRCCSILLMFKFKRRCVGSWFVLERWIAENPFQNARSPAQSDLDVVHGPAPKGVLQHHWDRWMTDADWKWIAERGINTVRIPVRV